MLWLGDINVAPQERDVHNPKGLRDNPDFHIDAREALGLLPGELDPFGGPFVRPEVELRCGGIGGVGREELVLDGIERDVDE